MSYILYKDVLICTGIRIYLSAHIVNIYLPISSSFVVLAGFAPRKTLAASIRFTLADHDPIL